MEKRYNNPEVNRAYHLTESMIRFRSYTMGHIDKVAAECSDAEVEAFCKIVSLLNKES